MSLFSKKHTQDKKERDTERLTQTFEEKKHPSKLELASYQNCQAHLLDELRWLNRLLSAHVLRMRRVNFYNEMKDFRGFFIADDEIDALVSAGIFEDSKVDNQKNIKQIAKLLTQAKNLREEIDQNIKNTLVQNISLPLVHLGKCFRLSKLEIAALVICLAPQIDASYEKLYAYLQNDISKRTPSIDLILSLLCNGAEERLRLLSYLHSNAPLLHYRLLEFVDASGGTSAAQHFLRAEERIVDYVLGNQAIDRRIQPFLHFLPPGSWENIVLPEVLESQLKKLMHIKLSAFNSQHPILNLFGKPGVGKRAVAQAFCGENNVSLAVINSRSLMRDPSSFIDQVRIILREGLLQPCAVYFDNIEKLEIPEKDNYAFLNNLVQEVSRMGWLTFLGSNKPLPIEMLDFADIHAIEIPFPDYAAQKKLWEIYLNDKLTENERPDFDQYVSHFNLTGGQIARAVLIADHNSIAADRESSQLTLEDIAVGCRRQSQPKFDKMAQKIQPVYTWNDIVLPEEALAQLKEICQRARHESHVLGEWGFRQKLSQGMGINALFAGPSGTGKTMAAEIISQELGLDLYKIDLSGVVSKYIGETEKNLDRIFTAAEHANVILFFDEADALFGKRSEVRDSHDRYANIEISYLLQKMEQYQGIAILATNLRHNLDDSFVRRLTFAVPFPFQDEASRLQIWKSIWPEATPIDKEINFEFLAHQFKLSGGNIKNSALAAAFLAAESGSEVKIDHIMQGIRREYQKMGKALSDSEMTQHKEASTLG